MTSAPWLKPLQLALCAGVLALAMGSPASAQFGGDPDDEFYDSPLNLDRRLMDDFLGSLGLISRTPPIEYRERSPLVIPNKSELPAPGARAEKGPEWPADPEVKARKARAAEARTPPRRREDPGRPIAGTDESYRTGDTGKWDESRPTKREPNIVELFTSGKMFDSSLLKKEEYGTFTGEPPRASLVAPPAGYLTPSPAAPYGVTPRSDPTPKKEPKL